MAGDRGDDFGAYNFESHPQLDPCPICGDRNCRAEVFDCPKCGETGICSSRILRMEETKDDKDVFMHQVTVNGNRMCMCGPVVRVS